MRCRRRLLGLGLALAAIVMLRTTVGAGILDVSWVEPTTNVDGSALTNLAWYRVYYGASGSPCPRSNYLQVLSPGPSPPPGHAVSHRLTGLSTGASYFVSVTAVSASGAESDCFTPAQNSVARIDFSVSPTGTLDFARVALGDFVERTLAVRNTGGGTVTGTVSTSAPFSVVSGSALSLAGLGATQLVSVRFTPALTATASASLIVTANGGRVSRILTGLGVTDATPPTVAILGPTVTPTYVTRQSSLTLQGTASDNIGVTQVRWTNDRGGSGTASGTTDWIARGIVLQLGVNVVSVTARDADGNTATTRLTVTRADSTPPVVRITAPTSGSIVSGNVTISATASDNVGVVGVQLRVDGVNLGPEVTAAPYAITWKTSMAGYGAHSLTAIARDAAGNATISAAITVTVGLTAYPASARP